MDILIDPRMAGVSTALIVVGAFLKKNPVLPNKFIPIVIIGLGVVAGVVIVGPTVSGVINGAIAGASAVAGHQLYKQTSTPQA